MADVFVQAFQSTVFENAFPESGGSAVYPAENQVLSGVTFGPNGNDFTGNVELPDAGEVIDSASFGAGGLTLGTYETPAANEVIDSVTFGPLGAISGTVGLPDIGEVLSGTNYGPDLGLTGTYVPPTPTGYPTTAQVLDGVAFGPSLASVGVLQVPDAVDVRSGTTFGPAGTETGTLAVPLASQVLLGVAIDDETGTVRLPSEDKVELDYVYGPGDTLTGSLVGGTSLDSLLANQITIIGLLSTSKYNNRVTVVQSTDYLLADGKQISWTNSGFNQWPDLTGATVVFTAVQGDITITKECVITEPTGLQSFYLEFLDTELTSVLAPSGNYRYRVDATLSSGSVINLITDGTFRVLTPYGDT